MATTVRRAHDERRLPPRRGDIVRLCANPWLIPGRPPVKCVVLRSIFVPKGFLPIQHWAPKSLPPGVANGTMNQAWRQPVRQPGGSRLTVPRGTKSDRSSRLEDMETGGVRARALGWRFSLEVVLGSLGLLLFALTLVWKDWIEVVFRIDPDKGNGAAEYLVAFVLLAIV